MTAARTTHIEDAFAEVVVRGLIHAGDNRPGRRLYFAGAAAMMKIIVADGNALTRQELRALLNELQAELTREFSAE